MLVILGSIILLNIIGFQWGLITSIFKGKKISAMMDKTLNRTCRLRRLNHGAITMVFCNSALIS